MAKVYISSHSVEEAKAVADKLAADGHTVVSEWHAGECPRVPLEDAAAWRAKADRNFQLIESADVLVLIGGKDRVPGGKFVEAGYAMKEGVRVIALGQVENGMMHAAEFAPDVQALLSVLAGSA